MRYQLLGKSGLRVSEICLGVMLWRQEIKETSRAIFDRFAEAGGNFIDTAINYTGGESEAVLGDLLKADRDHFVVATKYSANALDSRELNKAGNSRKNMLYSVEQSLKRLQTDYIDVYYLHVWDYTTPLEEIMRAADDLIRQGKILYFAFSDTPSWVVSEACTRAQLMGWTQPAAVQVPYSLAWRDVERNTLPMANYWDMSVCAWGALDGGVLTGKYAQKSDEPRRQNIDVLDSRRQKIVDALQQVADEVGASLSQVASNWVRQSRYARIIPILGISSVNQLNDNLAALEWQLTDDQVARLNASTDFVRGFPEDFVIDTRQYLFGAMFDLVDNHRASPYTSKA
jgi:aryl-alcohol dehydrogenase-like predicted oxidoreductase